MTCEWRDIIGYEGIYQVSNTGQIRSLERWNGHKRVKRESPYIMSQSTTTTGYKKVELQVRKNRKSLKVHRLVAMAFISNPENKPNINHKDGNPTNNRVDNLEWCTQKENVEHAYATGLIPKTTVSKEELQAYVESGLQKRQIARLVHMTQERLGRFYKAYGIHTLFNKYEIDKEEFKRLVRNGATNAEMAAQFRCPKTLIARMKYKMKKGDYGE